MTFLKGPAVVLGPPECARLDNLIMRALLDARLRGHPVSAAVEALAADVHQVAELFRTNMLIKPGSGTCGSNVDAEVAAWWLEEQLSTEQAALVAGVSPGYMRRLIRRGDLEAARVHGGGWVVSGTALAVWLAGRDQHEEHGNGRGTERRRAAL